MEHRAVMEDRLRVWAREKDIDISHKQSQALIEYAAEITEKNKLFNLTGFTSCVEILENLIIGSIEPLAGMHVPRGTLFADIGTGSGIPGVPLSIFFSDLRGVLFDSSEKKMLFVRSVIERLRVGNLSVLPGRIEEKAHEEGLRKKFNLVVSRAFGPLYVVVELAAPLLVSGGFLYVYASEGQKDVAEGVLRHAAEVGLVPAGDAERALLGIGAAGIVFEKHNETEDRYPRRYAVIRREAERIQ